MNLGEEYALPIFGVSASLSMLLGVGIMLSTGWVAAPGAVGFGVVNATVGVIAGLILTGIAHRVRAAARATGLAWSAPCVRSPGDPARYRGELRVRDMRTVDLASS